MAQDVIAERCQFFIKKIQPTLASGMQFKEMSRFYFKLNPFKNWSDPKNWQVKDKGFRKGFINNDNEIENHNLSDNWILVSF